MLHPVAVSGTDLLGSGSKRSFGGTFGNKQPSGESILQRAAAAAATAQRETIPGEVFEEQWRLINEQKNATAS